MSDIPKRSFMDDPTIEWKTQKPDYTAINEKFVKEKTRNHQAGSLERVVEDLVKTWEMESSHKVNEKTTEIDLEPVSFADHCLSFMDDPTIEWKTQKPDYTAINEKFVKEKTRNHQAGSLERVVEDLVKTWEMESSHKVNEKDWQSVDKDAFFISVNGGKRGNIEDNIELGNYNLLLADCPLYAADTETNDSSHTLFRSALPGGFAWELLELHSGPPKVSFTWRHWGSWEGECKGNKPTGEILEMFGSCVVNVTPDLKIQSIEVFYDPNPMMAKLVNFDKKKMCPVMRN